MISGSRLHRKHPQGDKKQLSGQEGRPNRSGAGEGRQDSRRPAGMLEVPSRRASASACANAIFIMCGSFIWIRTGTVSSQHIRGRSSLSLGVPARPPSLVTNGAPAGHEGPCWTRMCRACVRRLPLSLDVGANALSPRTAAVRRIPAQRIMPCLPRCASGPSAHRRGSAGTDGRVGHRLLTRLSLALSERPEYTAAATDQAANPATGRPLGKRTSAGAAGRRRASSAASMEVRASCSTGGWRRRWRQA